MRCREQGKERIAARRSECERGVVDPLMMKQIAVRSLSAKPQDIGTGRSPPRNTPTEVHTNEEGRPRSYE
jgi:hypothetical protein